MKPVLKTGWRRWLIPVALMVAVLILLLFAPWPTAPISLAGGMFVGQFAYGIRRLPQPWRLRHTWPIIVATLAVSAVASGLSGNPGGIAVADFSLRQEAQNVTPNGVYAQVAESANIVYLWDCKQPGRVVGISRNDIVGFQTRPPKNVANIERTPFELIVRHRPIAVGFQPPC